MTKKRLCAAALLLAIALLFAGCPMVDDEGPQWPDNVEWKAFPDDAIQYAVAWAGGIHDAGKVVKNADGTWDITIKYTQGNEKSQIAIGGEAIGFKRDFWVTAEFPETAAVKPQKFMVLPSPSFPTDNDPQSGSDWGSAWQSQLQGFPATGPITGEIKASNADTDGNTPNLTMHTLVLWLYFDIITPSGEYTFKLKEVKAGNLAVAGNAPPVEKAAVRIAGGSVQERIIEPKIAGMDYRIEQNFTAQSSTGLEIDIKLPESAEGKTYLFDISATAEDTTNLLTDDRWSNAYIAEGTTAARQNNITTGYPETEPHKAGYYKITGKAVAYTDLFGAAGVGMKLVIPFASSANATRCVSVLCFTDSYAP
jgi:hypothetical protein